MAKYRIKVEALDPVEELRAEYRVGIECDRFYFAAITDADKDGDKAQRVALERVSTTDLAHSILECDALMEAAFIAEGMRRGYEYRQSRRQIKHAVKVSGEDMKNLFRKMMGEDE